MVAGYRPEDLSEALQIRSQQATIPFAGGTDLMVQRARRAGLIPDFDKPALFLGHLTELQQLYRQKGKIHIGAGVTLNALLDSVFIPPILKEIVIRMASHPTRNLATIGGNICNASPAGDTLPYLVGVDVILILQNIKGIRDIPVTEFITGPGETSLQPDELLTEIVIPDKKYSLSYYKKVGTRRGMSLAKMSFLGLTDFDSGRVQDIRIAFGAVAPQVVRSAEIEKRIIGKTSEGVRSIKSDIAKEYDRLLQPIDDARSSRNYRRKVSLRLLNAFLEDILKRKAIGGS